MLSNDDTERMEIKPRRVWPWALALALAVLLAYLNAYRGEFFFDDVASIFTNDSLDSLARLDRIFLDGRNVARPLVSLSFAVERAFFGDNSRPYHVSNIAVHIAAALLLFGIVRRTLLVERSAAPFVPSKNGAALGSTAEPIAFGVALLWGLHPLQTEAVTYIVQRAESWMGFFFLLTLYGVIRGAKVGRGFCSVLSANSNRTEQELRSTFAWHVLAVVACLLGAGCKQVIAAAPLIVLLYDRCFISGSFGVALRRAPLLYLGLTLSWLAIAGLLALPREDQSVGAGVNGITRWDYLRSESVVIAHYLRLSIWPWHQCFDYRWPVETNWARIVPCGLLVLSLMGVTIWQLARNSAWGVVGAWFFLILAPTSSFLPIADLACERRMYLPLAAVMVCVVVALAFGIRAIVDRSVAPVSRDRLNGAALRSTVAVLGLALGFLTFQRNALYGDIQTMWEDVLVVSPTNTRALMTVGHCSIQKNDWAKARTVFERAVQLEPHNYATLCSLGKVLVAAHDYRGAAEIFQRAVEAYPIQDRAVPALLAAERNNKPFEPLELAARANPNDARLQLICAARMLQEERYTDALAGYARAVADMPENPGIAHQLAWLLSTLPDAKFRDGKRALALAEKAAQLSHRADFYILDTLAAAQAETGDFKSARATAEEALKLLPPDHPLGKELREQIALFQAGKAVRVKP